LNQRFLGWNLGWRAEPAKGNMSSTSRLPLQPSWIQNSHDICIYIYNIHINNIIIHQLWLKNTEVSPSHPTFNTVIQFSTIVSQPMSGPVSPWHLFAAVTEASEASEASEEGHDPLDRGGLRDYNPFFLWDNHGKPT
jgi:hypothetical protein